MIAVIPAYVTPVRGEAVPMIFKLAQPNVLTLGMYTRDGFTVAMAKLRDASNALDDCGEYSGPDSMTVLSEALTDLAMLRARRLAVVTNDKGIIDFLTPPIKVPQRDTQKVRTGKKRVVEIPAGGRDDQWNIVFRLASYEQWRLLEHNEFKELDQLWHTMKQD